MPDAPVIRITPPLTLEEMRSFGEFRTVCCYPAEDGGAGSLLPREGMNYYPHWMQEHLQAIVDFFPGHEFTGCIEARNSSPGQPPVSRFVMRGRMVVRLDPFIGWPPEQADDSENGLMEILADPDSIVSVTQQCAGYATDVWETVPADDTDLPERLLAWRDAAVQRALTNESVKAAEAPQWAIWSYVQGAWWAEEGYSFVIDVNQAGRFTAHQARTLIDEEARGGLADGRPRSLMMLGPEVRTVDDDVTVMNARLKWAFQNEMRKYGPDGQRSDIAEAVS